tara:strand:- start:498 stop:1025 length:528 start_codon:yes stop_codon:yes gene_type:complete
VIKLDILEKQVKPVYLGIGSNLGNKRFNIELAKKLLMRNDLVIKDSSSYYESPSWPNKNFPRFLNIVIKINTNLSLFQLFRIIKHIEKKIGRKKSLRNYPRECDIDIIDFKGLFVKTSINEHKIETPHPRMNNRNFVIFPLFELNKTWVHPKTKESIHNIINQFNSRDFSDIRIV